MKQTFLFLVLLVAGLAVLAFLVGGDDLFRDYEKPEIEPGAVGPMPESVGVGSRGQQAQFGLPSRLEGPFTEPRRVRDPDTGEVRQARTSYLVLPEVSRFEGGVFSKDPVLDLYREDGTVAMRLKGDLGTLYATAAAGASSASLDAWEADNFHVTGNVVVDWMDDTGETVELQILTESLLIPGPDPEGGAWDSVECPEPLTIRRPDGSLSLRATRARVEPGEHLAVLSGPVHMEARGLDLLPSAATGEPELLIVDGDGELIYRWEEKERPGGNPVARMRGGTMTLARNVHAKQGDRWVHGEHLEMRLGPREEGGKGLEVRRLVVTAPGPEPVRFGLFQGEGSAESIHLNQNTEELRLQGPFLLEGVSLERVGRAPLVLDSLRSSTTAVVRAVPVAEPDNNAEDSNAPRLLELELQGEASLVAPELADALADQMFLTLRQERGAEGAQTSLERLILDGSAELHLPERQGLSVVGHADLVTVQRDGTSAHRIQFDGAPARVDLTGDAEQRLRGGFLEGPNLVVVVPDDAALQPTVELPVLERAEFALTADTVGALTADRGQETQRVVVEPRGPCRLDADGDLLALQGPIHLRLPRPEGEEATVDCGSFRLEDLSAETPVARAGNSVHLVDPEQGLELTCDSLELGEQWVAEGPDTHAVQEPADGPRLELWGDKVVYAPETGALMASRKGGLARVQGPEELLDAILPAPEGPDVVRGLVFLEAPSLELRPQEDPDSGHTVGRLIALGGTTVTRERDAALIEAWDVDVDLVTMEARLDAAADAPLLFRQPVAGRAGLADEIQTRWIKLREQGGILEFAPGAVFLFHLRGSDKEVELHCDGPTILEGSELRSDEGVSLSLSGSEAALTARADHLVVVLDGPLLEGGRPVELLAQKNVEWHHPEVWGKAALLAYHMGNQALDIKAGTEPCSVDALPPAVPFPMRAMFRRITAVMRLDQPGLPLKHLVMEYGHINNGGVARAPDPSSAAQR